MNIFAVKPSTLGGIKSLAKKIKRDRGIPYHEALDLSAHEAGFQNFRHAQQLNGLSPALHTIFLSAYWFGPDGAGCETLMLQIQKPLSEIASRYQLDRAKNLAAFRLEFADHIERRTDLGSRGEARSELFAAVRTIKFMEATSLRPAMSAEQEALITLSRKLPGNDHGSYWVHSTTGAGVYMDEPYPNPDLDRRVAWALDRGIQMVTPQWEGIHAPGRSRPYLFCTDPTTAAQLQDQLTRLQDVANELELVVDSAPYRSQFVSPARQAASKPRRPRAMPAMRGLEVDGALPYGAQLGGEASLWRPAQRMPLDLHLVIGPLLSDLAHSPLAGIRHKAIGLVRTTLDNWLHMELPDNEMTTEQFNNAYYGATPKPINEREKQIEALQQVSALLQQGYADCKPRREMLKQIHGVKAALLKTT